MANPKIPTVYLNTFNFIVSKGSCGLRPCEQAFALTKESDYRAISMAADQARQARLGILYG